MADFFQNGVVSTLHKLDRDGGVRIEHELTEFSRSTSAALVLPALYAEFETPAMARIVEELKDVQFLRHIVVALGQANEQQYRNARSFFRGFRTPVSFLQVDHPGTVTLLNELRGAGIDPGPAGKGRACWLACGYLLAQGECSIIALHDCDIRTYSRGLLSRLLYPMMHPGLQFEFCKGYYARTSDRLHGRVTRLYLTPLVRALQKLVPGSPFLAFLDSFRYALAGEFAMTARVASSCRLPGNWGLEVGMLSEVWRLCAPARVCQTELADNYDHKHQSLSADNPSRGLQKMASDIGATLLRVLASHGSVLGRDQLRTLESTYSLLAEEMIGRYEADALINGLCYDRHEEETSAAVFRSSLNAAADQYIDSPLDLEPVSSWSRVRSALPGFLNQLANAVRVTDTAAGAHLPKFPAQRRAPLLKISPPLIAAGRAHSLEGAMGVDADARLPVA